MTSVERKSHDWIVKHCLKVGGICTVFSEFMSVKVPSSTKKINTNTNCNFFAIFLLDFAHCHIANKPLLYMVQRIKVFVCAVLAVIKKFDLTHNLNTSTFEIAKRRSSQTCRYTN